MTLCMRISPPCSRTIFRLTGRPSPVPRLPFVLTNGLKISSTFPGGMPGPLSSTITFTQLPSVSRIACTASFAWGRSSSASIALLTRFNSAVNAVRVARNRIHTSARMPFERDVSFRCAAADHLNHVFAEFVQVGRLNRRFPFLRVAQHVENQIVDAALVPFNESPAFAKQVLVVFLDCAGEPCRPRNARPA